MKKTLMALGAAAALTVSAVSIPAPAQAQRGVAAGVAAGLIGGAIVGGAIASQHGYYYGPGYYCARLWRPGLCGRSRLRRILHLAAAAVLGWLRLARPQRQGLRLSALFIFIKLRAASRNGAAFPGSTAFPA